jgi:hypothetical protein
MTIQQIETILKGKFTVAADKQYWETSLAELKQKEQNAKENAEYFRKMKRYDR